MENQTEVQARNFWEKTWGRFLKFHGMIAPSAKLVQHLFNHVRRNGLILDLGCGEGRNSLYLSQVGYNIIGVDLSFKAARVMKNNFFEESLKGLVLAGDARILPFKSDSVDAILGHHIFDHLDKKGLELALREAFRVLKSDGVMLITMDNFSELVSDPSTVVKDDGSIVVIKGPNKGMLVRPFEYSEIPTLSQMGWEILKSEETPSKSKIFLLKKSGVRN